MATWPPEQPGVLVHQPIEHLGAGAPGRILAPGLLLWIVIILTQEIRELGGLLLALLEAALKGQAREAAPVVLGLL